MEKLKNKYYVSDLIFNLSNEYENLETKEKKDAFFNINSRIAIKLPNIADKLNHKDINTEFALDCIRLITKKYKGVKPGWIYTTTKKEETVKKLKYTQEAKDFYILINEIDENTFNKAIEINPKEMQSYLTSIDKQLKLEKHDK